MSNSKEVKRKGVIRNNFNSEHHRNKMELYKQKSVAVPNESYTIKELYDKHVRGQALPPIAKPVVYPDNVSHDSFDYEDLAKADLVDKMEAADYLKRVTTRGRNAEAKLKAEADKKAKAERDELEEVKRIIREQKQGAKKKENEGSGQKGASDDN